MHRGAADDRDPGLADPGPGAPRTARLQLSIPSLAAPPFSVTRSPLQRKLRGHARPPPAPPRPLAGTRRARLDPARRHHRLLRHRLRQLGRPDQPEVPLRRRRRRRPGPDHRPDPRRAGRALAGSGPGRAALLLRHPPQRRARAARRQALGPDLDQPARHRADDGRRPGDGGPPRRRGTGRPASGAVRRGPLLRRGLPARAPPRHRGLPLERRAQQPREQPVGRRPAVPSATATIPAPRPGPNTASASWPTR